MTQPQSLDLDTIQAREQAATPGPWGYFDGDDYADIAADYQQTGRGSYTCRQGIARIEADSFFDDPAHEDADEDDAADQMRSNAAFIAHARADVPKLIARVRDLETEQADTESGIEVLQTRLWLIEQYLRTTPHHTVARDLTDLIEGAIDPASIDDYRAWLATDDLDATPARRPGS